MLQLFTFSSIGTLEINFKIYKSVFMKMFIDSFNKAFGIITWWNTCFSIWWNFINIHIQSNNNKHQLRMKYAKWRTCVTWVLKFIFRSLENLMFFVLVHVSFRKYILFLPSSNFGVPNIVKIFLLQKLCFSISLYHDPVFKWSFDLVY